MTDEQVKEAGWVAQSVTGVSAYLYGIGCVTHEVAKEIAAIVQYIKKGG